LDRLATQYEVLSWPGASSEQGRTGRGIASQLVTCYQGTAYGYTVTVMMRRISGLSPDFPGIGSPIGSYVVDVGLLFVLPASTSTRPTPLELSSPAVSCSLEIGVLAGSADDVRCPARRQDIGVSLSRRLEPSTCLITHHSLASPGKQPEWPGGTSTTP
jgi:hypothetical protein